MLYSTDTPDLLLKTAHHRRIGSQSTLLVLKQRQSVNLAILQALDIVAHDRLRQVAGEQVMDAQDLRGALTAPRGGDPCQRQAASGVSRAGGCVWCRGPA